jgi:hypothetical protein
MGARGSGSAIAVTGGPTHESSHGFSKQDKYWAEIAVRGGPFPFVPVGRVRWLQRIERTSLI